MWHCERLEEEIRSALRHLSINTCICTFNAQCDEYDVAVPRRRFKSRPLVDWQQHAPPPGAPHADVPKQPCYSLRTPTMTETTDPPGLGSVPIAQLEPSLTCSGKTFEGVVTLIWPYSASNASFSILLAEPDFRLRRQQGQVRIHFSGSSAKAVSRCDPQSGDQVILQLDGAQWEKDETVSKTPGRGINWQLRFEERATLKVWS